MVNKLYEEGIKIKKKKSKNVIMDPLNKGYFVLYKGNEINDVTMLVRK